MVYTCPRRRPKGTSEVVAARIEVVANVKSQVVSMPISTGAFTRHRYGDCLLVIKSML